MKWILPPWVNVAWAFLKRIPWQLWAALAVLVLLWGIHHAGVVQGRAQVQASFNAYKAEVIAETAIAKQKAAAKEAADRAAIVAINEQYRKDVSDAQHEAARLAADLRAGRQRLRQQWTCPASVPGAAADPTGADAAAAIREQGAVDLVRAAAEADAWISALQSILNAERK